MQGKKLGSILFILDDRLTRERAAYLTRVTAAVRPIAYHFQVVKAGLTEEQILEQIQQKKPHLVLLPWYRYLAWSKIEGHFGLTRSSGATVAGYHCEPLLPYELSEPSSFLRTILLDFCQAGLKEIQTVVASLLHETLRSGLSPMLDPSAPIYCENWFESQGLGLRLDTILSLPEIAHTDWSTRSNEIRICLMAFWNLVYELGPGKSDLQQTITIGTPKAYFQIGADARFLLLRLCFKMPSWGPKDTLLAFWPDAKKAPTDATQLLLRYTDFLRVHPISETSDVEIVAGFTGSSPSRQAPDQIHTFWIEPLSARLVSEAPYQMPSPEAPRLKALPSLSMADFKSTRDSSELRAELKAKEKHILEASQTIRELSRKLKESEDQIQELRMGGVGSVNPLLPPGPEELLEAFQEKYHEARFQIRQFERQIHQMSAQGTTSQQIEQLRAKMLELGKREREWIQKLEETLTLHRGEKKKC